MTDSLDEFRALLLNARNQLAEAQKRASDWQQVIDGLSSILGIQASVAETPSQYVTVNTEYAAHDDDTPHVYPKPKDAILAAMATMPRQELAPREILSLVRQLGMYNPNLKSGDNGYTTALRRLAEEPHSGVSAEGNGYLFTPKYSPGDVLVSSLATPRAAAITQGLLRSMNVPLISIPSDVRESVMKAGNAAAHEALKGVKITGSTIVTGRDG